MDRKNNFASITLEDFNTLLEEYTDVVPAKLIDLDKARYETVPIGLETNTDGQSTLSKAEVVTLVEWKLSHGTFRPTLKALVNQNGEETIGEVTANAFEQFSEHPRSNAKSALAELTKLKGIGPATASLLLSVYDPDQAPFFSDELFRWAFWNSVKGKGWDRSIKYTPKEYLRLFEKVQELRERLGVKAVEAEKVAYVLGKRATGEKPSKGSHQPATTDGDTARKAASHDGTAAKAPKAKALSHVDRKAKVNLAVDKPSSASRTTRSSARLQANGKK